MFVKKHLVKKFSAREYDGSIQKRLNEFGSDGYKLNCVVSEGTADASSLLFFFDHGGEEIGYSYGVIITDKIELLEQWMNSFNDRDWSLKFVINVEQSTMVIMVRVDDGFTSH